LACHFAAVSRRNASASRSASPSIATCLRREVAPDRIFTLAFGTRSTLANSSVTARLASPPSATARTRSFSTLRPSARVSMPSISSRPPRGVTRSETLMPCAEVRQGSAIAAQSEDVRINVILDHALYEVDDQDQNDRRNIQPTQIG